MIQLCSESPRRIEILNQFKIDFSIIKSKLKSEPTFSGGNINTFIRNLSKLKGRSALPESSDWILTADTLVLMNNTVLGKPKSLCEATKMLRQLSGKTHRVITAICFTCPITNQQYSRSSTTIITFKKLKRDNIENYVYSKHPLDKAGGYGLQELPNDFIASRQGCYFNVVGLPIYSVLRLAKSCDILL